MAYNTSLSDDSALFPNLRRRALQQRLRQGRHRELPAARSSVVSTTQAGSGIGPESAGTVHDEVLPGVARGRSPWVSEVVGQGDQLPPSLAETA